MTKIYFINQLIASESQARQQHKTVLLTLMATILNNKSQKSHFDLATAIPKL